MTSCNSKDKSVSRRSESEEFKVDSVLQPMTFRENEIEFDDEMGTVSYHLLKNVITS